MLLTTADIVSSQNIVPVHTRQNIPGRVTHNITGEGSVELLLNSNVEKCSKTKKPT